MYKEAYKFFPSDIDESITLYFTNLVKFPFP